MVSDRLKKIIFDKLNKDLSKVEIIPHNNNVWFIDRENKYWYFELKQDGHLWWRYSFFIDFFRLFSLSFKEFEPIISEWVELILNRAVLSPMYNFSDAKNKVNEILNYTVPAKKVDGHKLNEQVDEVLNCKVLTTGLCVGSYTASVDEVLNCKVLTTHFASYKFHHQVDEVLNCKVLTTRRGKIPRSYWVERVLSQT
jgi:hypothetical protein